MPRTARDVVFVDGVRTPFGKAGPNGLYAETRADDMVVSVIRELLRRNPALPPGRIGEVAIAATTQTGDQGLTIGRSAAVLAGLPKSVPGYAIDRMCAGAMTAVTTAAGSIALGATDTAIAGGVEHMGHVGETLAAAYPDRYRVSPKLRALVAAGKTVVYLPDLTVDESVAALLAGGDSAGSRPLALRRAASAR